MSGNSNRSIQPQGRQADSDGWSRQINWLALGSRAMVLLAAVLTLRSMFQAEGAVSAIQDGVITIILLQIMFALRLGPGHGNDSDQDPVRLDRLERRLESLERGKER